MAQLIDAAPAVVDNTLRPNDVKLSSNSSPSPPLPPRSHSPTPTPIPIDLDPFPIVASIPDIPPTDSDHGIVLDINHDEPNGVAIPAKPKLKPGTASTKPASTAAPPAKPKSTKPAKPARSPSPSPPPPPPPPLQTIRLEIRLGGPDNYAVDIAALAKGSGQRPPTPPPVKRDTSDSDGDDEGDGKLKPKGKGKGGKKKNLTSEYYDLNDPFIDDSDLAIDERTYFAQTKQQGFYVSSGEVALLKDKTATPKKPKSKKVVPVPTIIPLAGSQSMNSNSASTSSKNFLSPGKHKTTATAGNSPPQKEGSRESPIALLSDGDGDDAQRNGSANGVSHSLLKRKTSGDSSSQGTGGMKKKRKLVEIESFHPDLQQALNELKAAIAQESFEQKGKFPPTLKPILAQVALKAITCGEYNDSFFSMMPKLFIYNKFTMTKLIKRTVYQDHVALIVARQDELLGELQRLADEGFPKAREEWEKSVAGWERRQEKEKAKVGSTSTEGTPVPGTTGPAIQQNAAAPAPPAVDDAESGMDQDAAPSTAQGGAKDRDKEAHPPAKKYRLTDRMKAIIWELVVLSNESCRIENEKNTLEGSTVQISEQGSRKVLYQKIVTAFPDGWMSSGHISREVSVMKKRFEAQQQEE